MPEIFRRKKFSYYLGEQRALDDIVVAYTNNPTPTPTPSITPSQTPTGTPNPTSTTTPTTTPTPTATTPICWDSFTISGSAISTLANGVYQQLNTFSGGSLDAGYAIGSQSFISGTAPDGNDYRVFGHYDGTFYYTYLWAETGIGVYHYRVTRTTGNYFPLGGIVQGSLGLPNSTGSTTPDGVYYYPIAQTYSGFPVYNLTRGNVCPTPTPTQTNTSTPTPSVTTTNTPTVTNTPSPTATPNALCPQQLILSASSPSYLYGLYNRATIFTGGTFETAWYNFDDNIMNYGTNPDGNDYVAFSINSGSDYTSLYWSSDIIGGDGNWTLGYSTGNTLFNGGTLISSIILDTNSLVDGSLFFPPNGNLQYNGGYINYPASCPTPTPTATVTKTPTSSPAPPFDADAAAYLAAILTAGATGITSTVSAATNTLVTSLKSAGIWSLIDAAYPFLGGNYNGVKFNIKDPQDTNGAYRISFNGSWTISSSGATPSSKSSSNYGDTYWSPNGTGGNRNDSHHYYRYINGVNNVSCDYAGVAGPYTMMGACSQLEWFDGGGALSGGGVVAGTAGYSQGISRTASNVCRFSRKLVGGSWTNFGLINTVATQSSNSMYIGAINGANFPEQMRYGFLSYGQGLTDTQLSNLDAYVTTFNTTLGRNF